MKKVGLLTLNGLSNFGNRLQNFAIQEVVKQYGFNIETISNEYSVYNKAYKRRAKTFIKNCISPFIFWDKRYLRYSKFLKFDRKIKYSKFLIDKDHIPENLDKNYDTFLVGSDQVWNPTFGRMSDIDFLTFAQKDKRNSISASFGINNIPEDMKELYADRLKNFNYISVREDRAEEIIKELTGREDVEVLIDPTMALDSTSWKQHENRPRQLKNSKYILQYFLGNVPEEVKTQMATFAKEENCIIIDVLDKNEKFYNIGPSEFLYLERNAHLICTDSFHSCVFAILFNRPFLVFERQDSNVNMSSRITTLLTKFKLEERKYRGKIDRDSLKTDYRVTNQILQKEREKFNCFIERCLKSGEKI